ncbi:MAG TPA: 3-hydroxyacyl-CoA dehydrogenase family protein [Tepidisphaeraceae bacterium]|jgi:3-hydroxybutyryl-CoA dehydrogenase
MTTPSTIGVAGLGLLGRGIATCLLAHGCRVIACEPKPDARDAAASHIRDAIEDLVSRGGFPPPLRETWRGRYVACEDVSAFAACEFVIESIVEDLPAKHALFDRIEQVVGPTVPIASNTSALPISSLQAARRHPHRFIGAHWAEPCHLTRFLEVVRGEQTDNATVEATLALGRRVGKDPTVVRKDVEGFIVNRLGYAMFREAFWLLENGVADVDTIDRAFRNALSVWANVAGPFRWMDLTGLPAYAAVMERLFPLLSASGQVPETMRRLVESGAVGVANGRGFYDYTPEEADRWQALLVENVWRVRSIQAELLPEGPQ